MHRNREKETERERECTVLLVITLPGVEWTVLLLAGLLFWAAAPGVL